jgi:hypothetical protein
MLAVLYNSEHKNLITSIKSRIRLSGTFKGSEELNLSAFSTTHYNQTCLRYVVMYKFIMINQLTYFAFLLFTFQKKTIQLLISFKRYHYKVFQGHPFIGVSIAHASDVRTTCRYYW